jgi:hypothetical protein
MLVPNALGARGTERVVEEWLLLLPRLEIDDISEWTSSESVSAEEDAAV